MCRMWHLLGRFSGELAEGMLDTFEITVICVVPSCGGTVEEEYKTKMFIRKRLAV